MRGAATAHRGRGDVITRSANHIYRTGVGTLAGVACAVLLSACDGAPSVPKIEHVLLISIDTCRADRLGCYGRAEARTPNIDKLAAEGCVFENVVSPVPLTLPAHSSMVTGATPPVHGVHHNLDYRLDESAETLAEVMRGRGFATGAVVSAFVLDSKFGLAQGFDTYDDRFRRPRVADRISERVGDEAADVAVEWLAEHAKERAFLFVHFYDPHSPYEPPPPHAETFADEPYSGEIAFVDDCIGRILARLRELNRYDSTLIIVTGDHGEMLGEHGESTHGYFVYQGAVRVPLVVRMPGGPAGVRIKSLSGLIDLAPTICSLVGVPPPAQCQGIDLSKCVLSGVEGPEDRSFYAESPTPTKYDANALLSVIASRWKYIRSSRSELYDLLSDPGESRNLATEQPDRVRALERVLAALAVPSEAIADGRFPMESGDRRRMEALGYVGGAAGESVCEFDPAAPDAKDLIGLHEMCVRLAEHLDRRQFADAEQVADALLRERPDYRESYVAKATIAIDRKDYAAALPFVQKAVELAPDDPTTRNMLGAVLYRTGRYDEALACFSRVISAGEESLSRNDRVAAHYGLAEVLESLGRGDEALSHFEQAVPLDPDPVRAHRKLAAALAARGRIDEAIPHMQEVLRLSPDETDLRTDLGTLLLRLGRVDEAIAEFRKSLALSPNDAKARYNLGAALARQGEAAEAVEQLRAALKVNENWLEPLAATAWILATHPDAAVRSPEEAIRHAERAATLIREADAAPLAEANILDTLAAAYAAGNRFEEARATIDRAIELARQANGASMVRALRQRRALYEQNRPYVEQARPRGGRR